MRSKQEQWGSTGQTRPDRRAVAPRHRQRSLLVSLAVTIGVLGGAGCAKKDEPSAANFERALDSVLKDRRLCTEVSPMEDREANGFLDRLAKANASLAEGVRADLKASKAKIISFPAYLADSNPQNSEKFRILTVLGTPGFLHGGATYQDNGGWGIEKTVAMLNEKGMAHYVERTEKNPYETRKVSRMCYGDLAVEKIIRWTAPADLMGHRVVNVEYTLKATGVAEWAKPMLHYFDQSKVRKALLVLTNEGWVVDEPNNVH